MNSCHKCGRPAVASVQVRKAANVHVVAFCKVHWEALLAFMEHGREEDRANAGRG